MIHLNGIRVNIGQYQLINSESARCPVRWSHPDFYGMSCVFSVRINTHPGEGCRVREGKALAEARRFARAFLQATEPKLESDVTSDGTTICQNHGGVRSIRKIADIAVES